ncbi:uncharacterized protein LOC132703420 isoform X1 [Cylas formicarius]|uniref:uncharacterized protein LOC132703420 isoform X1 n=2 Tax=Cylas formicarius TaxID=197179 RepID=UPI00295889EE|nr:uncharacterized protein LOC132703420 isoform X1 [Cylas formicarius]
MLKMNSIVVLLFTLVVFNFINAADIECRGIKFKCEPFALFCPVNQTLVPEKCSCGCTRCEPNPPYGGVGSSCVNTIVAGRPANNCDAGLACCNHFCVRPEHCC